MVPSFARSSSRQTFVLWPLAVLAFEIVRCRGRLAIDARFLPLLVLGYGQYYGCGRYRAKLGGGGPGLRNPPARLVTGGPYALTRNPMYVGHLIFTTGLALALRSPIGAVLLMERAYRFRGQVQRDEARLVEQFGQEYLDYFGRVKRWIPGLC